MVNSNFGNSSKYILKYLKIILDIPKYHIYISKILNFLR